MPPPDPWAFGLNHVLTIMGFIITATIALAGFRSFDKWKREKLEEKRIDIAIEALALAYEANFVFDGIRSPMSYESEWAELKGIDDPDRRFQAGPFFAILKRIEYHKDYFDRVWQMQPKFMAVFGKDASSVFTKLHQARRSVEVAASMLLRSAARNEPYRDYDFQKELEKAVWNMGKDADDVGDDIKAFVNGVEGHCVPIIVQRYNTSGRLLRAAQVPNLAFAKY